MDKMVLHFMEEYRMNNIIRKGTEMLWQNWRNEVMAGNLSCNKIMGSQDNSIIVKV